MFCVFKEIGSRAALSGVATEAAEQLIAVIRSCSRYSIAEDHLHVHLNFMAITQKLATVDYSDPRLDPVLVEIIATCHYLILSPSIQQLEDHIRAEMALPKVSAHLSIR